MSANRHLLFWLLRYFASETNTKIKTQNKMKKLMLFFLLSATSLFAQTNPLKVKHACLTKGVALSGYDAVSYFSGKPQKGLAQFKVNYEGIVYQFNTAANQETFQKNPSKYEPTCGGWCAYAIGKKNKKVEVDPENFKIVDGKLNLFYKDFFGNTLDDWNKDETNLKKSAQINWQKIVAQ